MLYRIYCITFVLIFTLVACSGNDQTIAPQTQAGPIIIVPGSTNTFIPVPSDTPLPTIPPTSTATPSLTPTATVIPENFVLANKGFDIANVRVSNPNEDVVTIDFEYRIDPKIKSKSEIIVIGVWFPPACAGVNGGNIPIYGDDPTFMQNGGIALPSEMGHGILSYRQETPGRCEMSSFELIITFMQKLGVNSFKLREVYREHIKQPIKVINTTSVTKFSDMVTTKNFAFQVTGPWTGKLTFDYVISPEFSARVLNARFNLDGKGDILYCRPQASGPYITGLEGTYVINVDMNQYNSADKRSVSCHNKLEKYGSLTFDQVALSLDGSNNNQQYIDFKFTLKKQP